MSRRLRVIRGNAPERVPMAARCHRCKGRRVIPHPIVPHAFIRCPRCNVPEVPPRLRLREDAAPVDAVAKAA
jgi:hypothetical protein